MNRRTIFAFLMMVAAPVLVHAQNAYIPDAGKVGLPMNGVFSGGSIDSVQVNNGNLHVDIPLLHIPGVGMDVDFHFVYDNQVLTSSQVPYVWGTSTTQTPEGYWYLLTMSRYFASISDPLSGYLKIGRHNEHWECGNPNIWSGDVTWVDYVSFSEPNGTSRPFSLNGYVQSQMGPCVPSPYYPSNDFASDASGYSLAMGTNGTATGVVDKHGTRYYFGSEASGGNAPVRSQNPNLVANPVIAPTILYYYPLAKIEDGNGNVISRNSSGAIVDTLNRTFTEASGPAFAPPGTIAVETLGNQVSSINYTDQNGQAQSITIAYQPYSINFQEACSALGGSTACGPTIGSAAGTVTVQLPHVITLQNGDTYRLDYYDGDLGELKSITLPTGGVIEYTYSGAGELRGGAIGRAVASRTVTTDGQSSVWNFNGYTVTDPYGNDTVYTCSNDWPCYMTNEVMYKGSASAATPLATRATTYTMYGCSKLPTAEKFTWNESGQTSEIDSTYDSESASQGYCASVANGVYTYSRSWGNLVSKSSYDYGTGGNHGALLSNTQFTYLHDSNPAYANANIADRVTQTSVYNSATASSSTLVAQSTIGYDAFTYGNQSGLLSAGWTTNHDGGIGTGYTLRGLPTSVSTYTGSSTAALTKYTNYNVLGQPTAVVDGRGNLTTNSYGTDTRPSGSSTDLLITTTLPSTTTNGTTITHTVKEYQDPNTGLVTAKIGQNTSQTTTFTYDSRMRPLIETRPSGGGSTSNSYPSATEIDTTVAEDSSGRAATTTVSLDGLGRKISSATTSDSICGPLTVDTDYDLMGRVAWVSNPHCSGPQVTDGYSQYFYDGLGRLTGKMNPDGSSQAWGFSGSIVDFWDETQRHWKHTYDAAARLKTVLEPDASGNPTMETDYTYDTLGNLTQVDQWGGAAGSSGDHIRKFAYDGASRLVASNNPESASPSSPAAQTCSGAVSGTLWSTCYSYDGNGNLISKIDNRGIQISYGYDALNRLLSKTYSDSTPSATFTYDSSTISGSANAVGLLTQAKTTSGSTTLAQDAPYAYDLLGRVQADQQCTIVNCGTTPYQLSFGYDYVGKPLSATFPSNGAGTGQPVTLSYSYDAAERLLQASSSWASTSDANHPPVLFQASTNQNFPAYGPMGLQNAAIGYNPTAATTTASLQRGYDDRGRIVNGVYVAGGNGVSDSTSMGSIVISGSEASQTLTKSTSSVVLSDPTVQLQFGSYTFKYYDFSQAHLMCQLYYKAGSVTVAVQSAPTFTISASFGGSDENPADLRSALASELNWTGSPVAATLNANGTISLRSVATGFSANYPVTIYVSQLPDVPNGSAYQCTN